MPNAIYPEYKEFILTDAVTNVSLNLNTTADGPYCALVNTASSYTYSAAHSFYSSLAGIATNGEARITTPTVANGTFDGDDMTFTSVTGTIVGALVIYRHNSGASGTWKLVCYLDTSITGLPVTPNGGNITIAWHTSGIFTI